MAFRELALRANGQARRRVEQVPQHVSSLLWVYTATVIGAAIMDLAARVLVPRRVEIDLLIAPALAPLFAADRRLRQVHTDPNVLPDDIDFLLLDSFRSTSLGLKTKRYPQLPFRLDARPQRRRPLRPRGLRRLPHPPVVQPARRRSR